MGATSDKVQGQAREIVGSATGDQNLEAKDQAEEVADEAKGMLPGL